MGWETSNRAEELPPGWRTIIRPRILARDGWQCVAIRGDTETRCVAEATDVDHIGDPMDHTDDNLQSLCDWHHKRKTNGADRRARDATSWRQSARHPTEAHPGLL